MCLRLIGFHKYVLRQIQFVGNATLTFVFAVVISTIPNSPNKRSLRGPGSLVREPDFVGSQFLVLGVYPALSRIVALQPILIGGSIFCALCQMLDFFGPEF